MDIIGINKMIELENLIKKIEIKFLKKHGEYDGNYNVFKNIILRIFKNNKKIIVVANPGYQNGNVLTIKLISKKLKITRRKIRSKSYPLISGYDFIIQ